MNDNYPLKLQFFYLRHNFEHVVNNRHTKKSPPAVPKIQILSLSRQRLRECRE